MKLFAGLFDWGIYGCLCVFFSMFSSGPLSGWSCRSFYKERALASKGVRQRMTACVELVGIQFFLNNFGH